MKIMNSWFGSSPLSRVALCLCLSAAVLLPVIAWACGQHTTTATLYLVADKVVYECKNTPACGGTSGTCYFFTPYVNETCKALDGSGSTYPFQVCQVRSAPAPSTCTNSASTNAAFLR